MSAKGRVSMLWQTVFCIHPAAGIFAAYRVKKLRWYLPIILGAVFALNVLFGAVSSLVGMPGYDGTSAEMGIAGMSQSEFGVHLTLLLIQTGAIFAVSAYVIRRWSKKWNLQFA